MESKSWKLFILRDGNLFLEFLANGGQNSENKNLMFAKFSPHQHHSSQLSVLFVWKNRIIFNNSCLKTFSTAVQHACAPWPDATYFEWAWMHRTRSWMFTHEWKSVLGRVDHKLRQIKLAYLYKNNTSLVGSLLLYPCTNSRTRDPSYRFCLSQINRRYS